MPKNQLIRKIVCLGDSITCEWQNPSYVTHLQNLLKQAGSQIQVIDAGLNGETAQDGYYRLDRDVLSHQPDMVMINFGHNEIRLGKTPEEYAQYIKKTINWLRFKGIKIIWLLTPNDLGDASKKDRYQPFLAKLEVAAKEKEVKLVSLFDLFQDQDKTTIFQFQMNESFPGEVGVDWIHPNQIGYQLIAQKLFNELKKEQIC